MNWGHKKDQILLDTDGEPGKNCVLEAEFMLEKDWACFWFLQSFFLAPLPGFCSTVPHFHLPDDSGCFRPSFLPLLHLMLFLFNSLIR